MDLHLAMAERSRFVHFGPVDIPILSPEHFLSMQGLSHHRPKDGLDIEEMVRWGTAIEADEALRWVADILGATARRSTGSLLPSSESRSESEYGAVPAHSASHRPAPVWLITRPGVSFRSNSVSVSV